MNVKNMAGVSLICVVGLLSTQRARAEYAGLSVQQHTTVTVNGVSRSVWRVYANFTLGGDRLLSVAGSEVTGVMTVQSRNSDDSGVGSSFYNFGSSDRAPTQADIDSDPNAQWDSFFSIGVSIADQAPNGDQTYFSPGFPALAGTSFTTNNAGYAVVPEPANVQHRADFLGDGDLALRVLMMQLTVNTGDNVRGTVALSARYEGPGNGITQTYTGQVFNSVSGLPTPGVLALLAIAGVTPRRRRR